MATPFRPLNDNELHALDRAVEKGEMSDDLFAPHWNNLRVSYERLSGGFCVCVLVYSRSVGRGKAPQRTIFRGASRQSMHDKPNRLKGDMLAFNRAIRESKGVTL